MRTTQSIIYVPTEKMPDPDYQNYGIQPQIKLRITFGIKKIKKSYIWSTLDVIGRFFNTGLVRLLINFTNKPPNQEEYGFNYSFEESQQQSELDKKITKLIGKKVVNESYVVDLYMQEEMFKDHFDELLKQGVMEVLVCGEKIFTGNNFDELLKQAHAEYPNRPFYSYSFKNEPMIL